MKNLTLIAVALSFSIQVGAQFFALAIIARVVSAAPPRSLAILEGPYRYDSSAFWQTVPAITAVMFLIATVTNWRTERRALLLGAFIVFLLSGVGTMLFLEPIFAEIVATGYSDVVDPALQRRAALWYRMDWGVRCFDAAAAVALLVALTRPTIDRA